MPLSRALPGESNVTGLPSTSMAPVSGVCTPDMIFSRVDLPAPLSPTTARVSPRNSSIDTSSSAVTAPKRLLTFFSRSTGKSRFEGVVSTIGGPSA